MRQVVLDTETTGIGEGHRIVEIGCVEIFERKLTGRHYHVYINPQRDIDPEAAAVHGITNEWLIEQGAPVFAQVAQEFREFIAGSQLVIHNAAFDVGMMDAEFRRLNLSMTRDFCGVLDTLKMARDLHPGARNSLDALCKRYGIDNSHRDLHGALLDAEILADVYLTMTGGQTALALAVEEEKEEEEVVIDIGDIDLDAVNQRIIRASAEETAAHEKMLDLIDKKSGGAIWRR
ncbi:MULTISPECIES: DNA polymerase III subunit epsilon [Oceanospirillaceae]|jgi:DNA polymerase-3 subunit epsilon|uniref:DNA polymerase III subunit epsilon n=1 Tax=Oceanospirillaceae TaxID=135620 RepID=UPI0011934ABE|nr:MULTISPECIES: DNA polymerase III subunit epsilon [Thalassolituus]MCA6060920.1 DNA polymerase III subunit epsilon [Thalassolituus sp. ST750PaO-4]MCB2387923.1 DNA polymerase III subunit epsilon [Thalassolituus alkanivorans]MCB2422449.1 DNA polymerase III subunit epsilon [Thalassolituus alkanivorans]TVV43739.1 DNA polymerase III subunit epsilon [Thalassolituus sp. C2-1]